MSFAALVLHTLNGLDDSWPNVTSRQKNGGWHAWRRLKAPTIFSGIFLVACKPQTTTTTHTRTENRPQRQLKLQPPWVLCCGLTYGFDFCLTVARQQRPPSADCPIYFKCSTCHLAPAHTPCGCMCEFLSHFWHASQHTLHTNAYDTFYTCGLPRTKHPLALWQGRERVELKVCAFLVNVNEYSLNCWCESNRQKMFESWL